MRAHFPNHIISFSVHMSVTFNIFVCLNSGSVWELYLLAVNILTARFCIRFSRFAKVPPRKDSIV